MYVKMLFGIVTLSCIVGASTTLKVPHLNLGSTIINQLSISSASKLRSPSVRTVIF